MGKTVTKKVTLKGAVMFPSEFICAADLQGKDVTLIIKSIGFDDLRMADNSKEKKVVMHFERTPKKLVLNKTNADSIAQVHGSEALEWVGKKITLYPTTCPAFGAMVDCIRVREKQAKSADEPESSLVEA